MLRFYKFDIFCLFFLKKNTKMKMGGEKQKGKKEVYIVLYI